MKQQHVASVALKVEPARRPHAKKRPAAVARSVTPSAKVHRKKGHGNQRTWDDMYLELKDFHSIHGHCKVPSSPSKHGIRYVRLNAWKNKQKRNKANLTKEKIRKLDALDLDWERRDIQTWDESFEKLSAFQNEHGHCNVAREDERRLFDWLVVQKKRRLGPYQGRPKLTKKEIEKLESIGVVWSTRGEREDEGAESSDYMSDSDDSDFEA